ncbi:MAG TPA: ComEC/Rec2 family competence protein, partial [Myxococcaceae bacterium]|nr:ComEC/Rec2 family competence protein [Myxococcaceae bacterium]
MGLDRASWRDLGNRPLFFPAAGLAFGASLELQTTVNARVFHGAAAFLALLGFLFARRPGAHLSVLAASVLIGVGLARMESATEIPDPLPLDSVRVEGVIEAVTTSADSTRLEIAVSRVLTPTDSPARFRIGVYALGAIPPLYAGQRILVPAHLKPQEATANPGQWDISGYRTRHAFLFTGSFDPRRLVVLSPPTPWRVWLANVQRELAARAKELAPSDQAAALYLTMAAGLRADLGPDLENRFALSGLAHVLSVSGLHVAALALLTLRSIRIALVRLWRGAGRSDARKWAGPLSVPLIWAYVIFTGNQPPAVRSAVMASSILAAMAIWSRADALNSLALASAALLIADPAAIADLSLQLSFMAVLSLILLSPAVRQLIPIALTHPDTQVGWRLRLHRILEEALQTLSASAAVILAGTPLIASAFHRVSLVGLVSNIVCLPLCGLLTALAAGGAGAFVLLPWAAVPFLWAGGWASQLLLWLADFFASLPGAAAPIPSFGAWQCALFFLGLFVFAIGEGRWRWVGLAAPVALLWVLAPWGTSVAGMRITFLSVGHGDAIV